MCRGLDILFCGRTNRVTKFVLHSNVPGHPLFNAYCKANFRIHRHTAQPDVLAPGSLEEAGRAPCQAACAPAGATQWGPGPGQAAVRPAGATHALQLLSCQALAVCRLRQGTTRPPAGGCGMPLRRQACSCCGARRLLLRATQMLGRLMNLSPAGPDLCHCLRAGRSGSCTMSSAPSMQQDSLEALEAQRGSSPAPASRAGARGSPGNAPDTCTSLPGVASALICCRRCDASSPAG